jgi:hypothetical protein
MKKFFLAIIFFGVLNASAQEDKKVDSIFYLLDTLKTPVDNRMWHIDENSSFKNYTIQCPCLQNNGMPTFFYSVTDKGDTGKAINKKQLKNIKLISLPALIVKAKQLLDTQIISRGFFFIEPNGKKYVVHPVALINPAIKIVSPPDVVEGKPDNSAFEINGLIDADSKKLAKYYNKSVITTGKIVDRKKITDNNSNIILLMIGAGYPDQDFMIMIKGDNINRFEPAFLYRGKRSIRVTGKVFEYMGKPTIEVTKENQIQAWPNK